MKLIAGLCNPGRDYENTRHNAGEMYLRELARFYDASFKADAKFFGETAKIRIADEDVWLLIPHTFMNKSGQAVAALANFYKIAAEDILVAHDELDIPVGTGRLKQGGGHGGHNGLRDIIAKLGNNKNFWRLRIGIGHPGDAKLVTSWVLNKAPQAEFNLTNQLIDDAVRLTEGYIQGDIQNTQQKLHSIKPQ